MKKVVMVSIALSFASAALAHEGMHGPGAEYDTDSDSTLSLTEYTAYLKATKQDVSKAKERFTALDLNRDGKLSSAEFFKGLPAVAK